MTLGYCPVQGVGLSDSCGSFPTKHVLWNTGGRRNVTNTTVLVLAAVWQIPAVSQWVNKLWATSFRAPRKEVENFGSDLTWCFGTKAPLSLWRASTKSQWQLWQHWQLACVHVVSYTLGMWLLQTPLPLLIGGQWRNTNWKCKCSSLKALVGLDSQEIVCQIRLILAATLYFFLREEIARINDFTSRWSIKRWISYDDLKCSWTLKSVCWSSRIAVGSIYIII